MTTPKHIAIIGAGIAGIACARTLAQAGHRVTVFEKSHGVGGRMSTRSSPFGTFDHGAPSFAVHDPRFVRALATSPDICQPWSANTVQVLDKLGHVVAASTPSSTPDLVPKPGMTALVSSWILPLMQHQNVELGTRVTHLDRDRINPRQWQLQTAGEGGSTQVFSGFDAVLLAIPAEQARLLLHTTQKADKLAQQIDMVKMSPCWAMMLAFPNVAASSFGPHWNAARSTHHRIAWLARESSKPGRNATERWTVQASADWSLEHLEDDEPRVQAKLLKAFSELTGIRATPSHVALHRWRYAHTTQALGHSHLWDATTGLGACGDWCLGDRVEDAFISGLELALSVV